MATNDIAIAIVFPDFDITVDSPEIDLPIPDLIPRIDLLPPRLVIHKSSHQLPMLGHAGILFIDGASGLTRYFEYGRYGKTTPPGQVRQKRISDVAMDKSGRPHKASLQKVLSEISNLSGKHGRISAAYIELSHNAFLKMDRYAKGRLAQNTDPKRAPYDLLSNSCLHFMKSTAEAGGAAMPGVVAPNPAGYIVQVRLMHRDLDYHASGQLMIEDMALE